MIIVDDRKDEVKLFDLISAMPDLSGQVFKARLESGDIQIHGAEHLVGVERKTIMDFVSSFRSGRLQAVQIPNMVSEYEALYIVLEGRFRPTTGGGGIDVLQGKRWVVEPAGTSNLTFGAVQQVINSFMLGAGVFVLRTEDLEETAETIRALHYWWGRTDHKSFLGFHRAAEKFASLVPPSLVKRVAKELPGVGWDRSCKIEDAFKSVKEMVEADEKTWGKIRGIGKVLARKIVAAFSGTDEGKVG